MGVRLPNGIILALATAYGDAKTISALSNANPGVATSTAHGFTDGDFIELTSGWQKINGRIIRVDDADTNSYELEGFDTTSTSLYPAGSGIGSARKITTFTQISQIIGLTTSGGDMQFSNFSFLENDFESQLPTQSSAQSLEIEIADDPSLAGYQALKTAGEDKAIRALKVTMPDGSLILYNGYVSFNETPTMTKDSIMTVRATFSLLNRPVRYAA